MRESNAVSEALFVVAVLKRIPRNRFISTVELEESLNESGYAVTRRRLQRVLKSICECEDLHVECDIRQRPFGYRQRVPESALAATNLTPQESLLLRLSQEFLGHQLPAPLMKGLQPLFDAAKSSLGESGRSARQAEWLKKICFVSESVPRLAPKIRQRIFDAVSEALYRDSKLRITYENQKGERTEGVVSPLGLVQQEKRLYLVCRFEGYDNVRHLALHRFLTAEVLEFPADRPKDFSLDAYVGGRHFNYSNGRKVRLLLEFADDITAKNLSETPFTRDQKLERTEEGLWRLEAVVDDSPLWDGWLATWSKMADFRRVERLPIGDEGDGTPIES